MKPELVRAARGLLGLSQGGLAKRVKVSQTVISRYESRRSKPCRNTLMKIKTFFEFSGIEFIEQWPEGVTINRSFEDF